MSTAVKYGPEFRRNSLIRRDLRSFVLVGVVTVIGAGSNLVADEAAAFKPPNDVDYRTGSIISEGTRMSAEVFAPIDATAKLPTIVMSHGWGGTAEHLRPDGVAFARAGFLVVAFDYRGWGKSDARVIAKSPPVVSEGKLIAEVTEVRGVVDPIDQTTDILNVISWVHGEERCDSNRIGIWGSSFSGGHVVYVAARDPRVKAFVSQVGSMDGRWVIQNPDLRKLTFDHASKRSHGQIGYPRPFAKFGGMTGQPVWEKLMRYAPIEDIHRCDDCAKLFIIAEHEELFDNKDHAIAAHNRAKGIKKLVTVKGIKHYGIYTEKRKEAQQLATDWFREHLTANPADKRPVSKKPSTQKQSHYSPETAFEYAKLVEPALGGRRPPRRCPLNVLRSDGYKRVRKS
ncbi:MAG: prolyl oligopeptidase family serine peptidase [Fuerstiella sp.]|nr:prolyl oligopeptidase family serine peptidase [Fuerstiella sp.]MCP4853545.1 prolyl oligopeptidase family serine peptidase [Fuerstiella sp.]